MIVGIFFLTIFFFTGLFVLIYTIKAVIKGDKKARFLLIFSFITATLIFIVLLNITYKYNKDTYNALYDALQYGAVNK